jgi:hypothetical protein
VVRRRLPRERLPNVRSKNQRRAGHSGYCVQHSADYHPLYLLHVFTELEHKTRVRHLAVDLHLWGSFVAYHNTTERHGFRDILGEYWSLQTLSIFGTPESPIEGNSGTQYSDLRQEKKEEIQQSLSRLGNNWANLELTVERNWEALIWEVWMRGVRLHRAETAERRRWFLTSEGWIARY